MERIPLRARKVTFREGRLGVDDLIPRVVESLRDDRQLARDLAKQYPVMLIDEFQDTDDQQYTLIQDHRIATRLANLVLIGDPKQAIYRFRGADINTYRKPLIRARSSTDSIPIGGPVFPSWKRSITCSRKGVVFSG